MTVNPIYTINTVTFKSRYHFQAYFTSEAKCREYLANAIWPDGKPVCAHCGNNEKIYRFKNGIHYKCAKCRKKFTVTMNTIFEKSKISLMQWFQAIYYVACHKKGISSLQMHEEIGVTKKTAWFMVHRIRKIYEQEKKPAVKLKNVMSDECFIGGLNRWRHSDKKVKKSQGRSFKDKTPVMGMLELGGELRAFVIPSTKARWIQSQIRKNVEPGSLLMTDEWGAYKGLGNEYFHEIVDHSRGEYARADGISTNAIESAWACLKGAQRVVHNNVSRKHLQKYVDAFVFRFNCREYGIGERMFLSLQKSYGKRLTYSKLVA